jgi:hypothetical protein
MAEANPQANAARNTPVPRWSLSVSLGSRRCANGSALPLATFLARLTTSSFSFAVNSPIMFASSEIRMRSRWGRRGMPSRSGAGFLGCRCPQRKSDRVEFETRAPFFPACRAMARCDRFPRGTDGSAAGPCASGFSPAYEASFREFLSIFPDDHLVLLSKLRAINLPKNYRLGPGRPLFSLS